MAASVSNIANLPGSSQAAGDKAPQHVAVVDTSGNVVETFGGGGTTQYTEGDIDTSFTGNAVIWEDASDTARVVSKAKPLPTQEIGADTFTVNQVSVAATATQIVAARTSRKAVGIMNHGTTAVYLGPANTVTTSNGLLLPANSSVVLNYAGDVYGIVASSTQTVSYGEEY